MRFPKLIAGGLAAALLTASIGGVALAQTASPTAVPIQQRAEELLSSFASKLGKTPAEVRTAAIAAQKERVAADVAAGRLTQAQADQINQRIDASGGLGFLGQGPGGKGRPGHHGGLKGPGGPGEMRGGPIGGAELATFLGVQPQELGEALRGGKSLAAFAQEKGKSRDQLKAFFTAQEQARLAAAVQSGRLTQAQADQRLAELASRLDQMIDRAGPVGGPGMRGQRGPGGPGQRGPAPAATVTPTRA